MSLLFYRMLFIGFRPTKLVFFWGFSVFFHNFFGLRNHFCCCGIIWNKLVNWSLHKQCLTLFFLYIVVVDLYHEYNRTAYRSNQIRYEQRPEYFRLVEDALKHKAYSANCHHHECRQCNSVGVACAQGCYCLGKISQYQTDACYPTANLIKCILFHNKSIFVSS